MASVFRSDVPEAMELLSEVILEPLISDEEVNRTSTRQLTCLRAG